MAKSTRRTNRRVTDNNEAMENPVNQILQTRHRLKCKNIKQKEFANLITDKEIVIAAGPAGVGKAQPLYSKILTPEGWTTMGEIKVGDEVIGSEGTPIKVVQTHPQGMKEIYRVHFNDGSYTDCCDEHLWLTQTYYDRNYRLKENGVRVYKPREGSVKKTTEIMDTLFTSRGDKNHTIPMVKPVNFHEKETFIDAYVMGCLLGDGGLSQGRITFTTEDYEIVEEISTRLNEKHSINKKSGKYNYSIIGDSRKNLILEELGNLNLKNTKTDGKYIPNIYKFNSIDVRLEILRGLMDTDGYVNKSGTSTFFTNTSKQLIDDVGFIINSLGGTYMVSEKIGKYKNYKGEIVECNKVYNLTISLPPDINPFKLNRKAKLVKPKTKYTPKRYITAIEPIGRYEAQCITVDSTDSLYVTDNFIVTHNSYISIARAIELLQNKSNPYQKLIISKPAIEADEKHGFLPGDMKDKMEPYIKSSVDIIDKIIGKSNRVKLEDMEIIVVEALAYIRGSSIDNSILVMEEVQNMSPKQVKTLLTRIGENTKFILSGDLDQSDRFKNVKDSGLYDAMNRHKNVEEIGFFEFDKDDIVRNPIISKILKNYDTVENNVPVPTIQVKPRLKPEYGKPKKKQNRILREIKIFFKKNFKF